MNTLQTAIDMDRYGPVICTLNPTFPIKEELVQARIQYEHPTFNVKVRGGPQITKGDPNSPYRQKNLNG
jgi:hypothetical protein